MPVSCDIAYVTSPDDGAQKKRLLELEPHEELGPIALRRYSDIDNGDGDGAEEEDEEDEDDDDIYSEHDDTSPITFTVTSPSPPSNMTIVRVGPDDALQLQKIASLLGSAQKLVTVAGAGISTNAGIPTRTFAPSKDFTP
ncbi:hypothetical protein B0T24DRAFT_588028 [Lasiosphaeria ovina]|uniref:Deacetylase sirtuin-type domain-containing protein n=1 Tax=Lasiosphaeria ovina TaxID=92902 RepID=A0AAE0NKX3_9PEZI|nr:hypothetical protein B0T24DRAFT_588028 [Lasiosphaeria ovina]